MQGGPTWNAYPLRGDSLVQFRQKIVCDVGIFFQQTLRYREFKKNAFNNVGWGKDYTMAWKVPYLNKLFGYRILTLFCCQNN